MNNILFVTDIFLVIILVLVVLFILIYAATNSDNDYSDTINQPKSFNDRLEIKRVGNEGEFIVSEKLNSLKQKYECELITNFKFIDQYGKEVEIDQILITQSMVYVIETKNWLGTIYGNEDEEIWNKYHNGKYSNPRNPIMQNERHIRKLKKMLGDHPPKMQSMIIILGGDFSNINSNKLYTLNDAINKIEQDIILNKKSHSSNYVKNIYQRILNINNRLN